MAELKHVGVLGMHWGHRKSVSKSTNRSGTSTKAKSTSFDERLAKAYGITKKNGKITMISLSTIPKIAATAFVADMAVRSVPSLLQGLAWTTGTVISNSPLR